MIITHNPKRISFFFTNICPWEIIINTRENL